MIEIIGGNGLILNLISKDCSPNVQRWLQIGAACLSAAGQQATLWYWIRIVLCGIR